MLVKIYGPPGTGKTTTLNKLINKYKKRIPLNQIMFVSFSNAAIDAIFTKMGIDYNKNTTRKYPYFRTLHGLCLSYLMSNGYHKEFSRMFSVPGFIDETYALFCRKNKIPYSYDITSEALGNQAISAWMKIVGVYYPKYTIERCLDILHSRDTKQYNAIMKWMRYKKDNSIYDWIDIETLCYEKEINFGLYKKPPRVVFFDEAQDFSPLEWKLIDYITDGIENVYFAGDDMQAIYSFKGSKAEEFLNYKCDEEIVLPKSYRLPSELVNYSNKIMELTRNKKWKEIIPAREGGKVVVYDKRITIQRVVDIALQYLKLYPEDSIYILFRTNYQASQAQDYLLSQGVLYKTLKADKVWNEDVPMLYDILVKKKYGMKLSVEEIRKIVELLPLDLSTKRKFNKVLDGGVVPITIASKLESIDVKKLIAENRKLKKAFFSKVKVGGLKIPVLDVLLESAKKPTSSGVKISIDTMHASKGLEADVVFLADGLTQNVVKSIKNDGIDNELRTYYVASTRARKLLCIFPLSGATPFISQVIKQ